MYVRMCVCVCVCVAMQSPLTKHWGDSAFYSVNVPLVENIFG